MPTAMGCPALRLQVPRCHNRSGGLWDHAATAIGVRRAGVAGDRVGARRKPPRGLVAADGRRACGHRAHRAGAAQAAAGGKGVRRHQRRRQHHRGGVPRRHLLRVRLSRRRRPSLRPQGAGCGFHPGVSGAADHPGHERADHAAVLLAGAAADRARHGVAAGAHARRRRRGRPFRRRQHLPRHGRGAACSSALIWRNSPAANCSW